MSAETTRRVFVSTALASGFALAVQPVSAETITTGSAGLVAGEVKIPAPGGAIPAYRAMPEAGTGHPIVLVVHEIFGVHEHIKDLCRRLAKVGYTAIAPDLYARQGDVSKIPEVPKIISDVVSKVPDAQVMADLDLAADFAASSAKGDVKKLAVTGFCWGGRIAWLYAAHQPKLKAAAAWYGRISGAPNDFQPKNPIDVASSLKVPVLGLYGGRDTGIPLAHLDMMRAELTAAKNRSEIEVFPDAQHGFNADYRPSFDKASAELAWKHMLDWFKKYGAA